MKVRDPTRWMWGEALDLLQQANRLQRQFCQLRPARQAYPMWEPPIDVFETERQFVMVVALPGVSADQVQIEVEPTAITVRGQRRQPAVAARGRIQQMELPYGFFERRIDMPGPLQLDRHSLTEGCLTLTLNKIGMAG